MQTLRKLMRNSQKVIILRNTPFPPTNPSATINKLFLISFHFSVVSLHLLLFVVCRELLFEGVKKLWDTISISIPAVRDRSVLVEATETKADCS